MTQQGKQMEVGACQSFAYHLLKLVLLANGDRYEFDSNVCVFFLSGKAFYSFKVICPC